MARAPEWFKFDPVKVGLDVEGMSMPEVGAYFTVARHLCLRGPLSETEVRRLCKAQAPQVLAVMVPAGQSLSLAWVEASREHAQKYVSQRVEAGKESAKKRNERSTTVKRSRNGRSTTVLSISNSPSSSSSSSNSQSSDVREAEVEPTFAQWFDLYDKRRAVGECRAKWATLDQVTREAIMDHTRRYVAAQPDKTYRKDPLRYLQKRGWEDEIITSAKTHGQPATEDDHLARKRAIIEANAKFYRERDAREGGGTGGVSG